MLGWKAEARSTGSSKIRIKGPGNEEVTLMFSKRRIPAMIELLLLGSCLAGCGADDASTTAAAPRAGGGSKVEGTVVVDGSSTVFRISKAAQEAFEDLNPAVTVVVDNHGTGGGFSRYLQGEVDIVDASRTAEPAEEARAKAQGIEWTRFFVGNDGITLVVNSRNTFVKSLTTLQLKTLWQPGSAVKTWKDLNPSWPDRKIILYSPDNDSGTFEFFTEAITGKKKSQREGVQQSADDNTLVNGVAADEDGLGYFGYAYYAANKERLRAVAVQNGPDAKPILPNPETIADKSYKPLSRPLFIFVKNSAARRPEVKQFLRFYLDNVEKLAVKGGYDPPTAEDLKANLGALAELYGGAEGAPAESSTGPVPAPAKK
jgi:phosphate transport system substrate-binding protein